MIARCSLFDSLLIFSIIAIINAKYDLPQFIRGRPRGGFLKPYHIFANAAACGPINGPASEDQYMVYDTITQKVNHSDENSPTWQQNYQYNSKFYDPTNGTVFLMIGGEGPISTPGGDKWVRCEDVMMMKWAKEFKAAAFQLEHRFYGPKNATPFGNQTTDILKKYMTIDHALADIKAFIEQMNAKYFPNDKPFWITFGGSYPGSLSAWFRATYPEYTAGAVSTSSAVHVFVDYYGYAVNTEKVFREVDNNCAEQIRAAFKNITYQVYAGKDARALLKTRFNLCDDFDEMRVTKSAQFFLANLYSYFQGYTQYTGDNRNNASIYGVSVEKACTFMTNVSVPDPVDRLLMALSNFDYWSPPSKSGCRPNSYSSFIKSMQDDTVSDEDIWSNRGWLWQTCTELGYFQTTDGGNDGIFGSTVPLDFYSDQCVDIFGPDYNLDNTFKWVEKVRNQYGGADSYKGTKVVFPNGSRDPWQSLGLTQSNDADEIDAFLINGTAHCADMYPPSPNDKPSLKDARSRIHDHLVKWLNDAQLGRQKSSAPLSIFCTSIIAIFVILFRI